MKKLIFSILIVFLCLTSFMLTSCNEDDDEENGDIIIDYVLPSFSSVEKYEEFIATTTLPSNFVEYEDICELGEFRSLVIMNPNKEDCSQYMYSILDESGTEFVLYVYDSDIGKYESFSDRKRIREKKINPSDMRRLKDDSNGTYKIDGILYNYVVGNMYSIIWEADGLTYCLSSLNGYPDNTSTFVSRMFNLDTVQESIEDLMN